MWWPAGGPWDSRLGPHHPPPPTKRARPERPGQQDGALFSPLTLKGPGQTHPDMGLSLSLGLSFPICQRSRRALICRTNIVWPRRRVARRKGFGACTSLAREHPLSFSGALTASFLEKKRADLLPASDHVRTRADSGRPPQLLLEYLSRAWKPSGSFVRVRGDA